MDKMSVKDVLEIVLRTLSNVQIPAALVEQIGIPVFDSIRNLRACIDAIKESHGGGTDGSD